MRTLLVLEWRKVSQAVVVGGGLILGLLTATSAWAHKIYLHAEVVGEKIQGRAYFRGGAPAQESRVVVLLPDGRTLLETHTDANGEFSFPVQARCDYRLVVETGDGHGAETTVPAEDLPPSLPPLEKGTIPSTSKAPGSPGEKLPPAAPDSDSSSASSLGSENHKTPVPVTSEQLLSWLEESVHRQIAPLHRKLQQMEDRIRWSDVLGGIGYIVGLTGMGFYLLGMRRNLLQSKSGTSFGSSPVAEKPDPLLGEGRGLGRSGG